MSETLIHERVDGRAPHVPQSRGKYDDYALIVGSILGKTLNQPSLDIEHET